MKRNLALILALTLVVSAMFAVTATAAERNGGTLIIQTSGDPVSFNPSVTADDYLYPIAQNLFHRLVKMDASKNVIADLAESWDVSDDALTITFHLHNNVTWHDGEPLTSKDVKYTFDYIKENETCYFSSRMADVVSIDTPDDSTVVFNMASADVSFIARLGWYSTFILPEHIFNNGQAWEDNPASMDPIGSGPFKFSEFKQGESVTLVANEDYYAGMPDVDKLVYTIIPDVQTAVQALVNGEIDVMDSIPAASVPELQANPDVRLTLNEYPSPMRIIFNLDNSLVQDLAVRKAIAYAINRDEISAKAFAGIQPPEYAMYPSLIAWASNSEDVLPSFDIAAAIQTLEDAGYEKDADGYYVRGLTLDVFEAAGYPDTAKLMAATLKQAGIELIVQVHEFNAWYQKVGLDRDFIIEMQGGFMGPDPSALRDRIGTDQGSNFAAYSNPKVDELLTLCVQTGVQEERAEYLKEAQKILAQDIPYINIVAYAAYDANRTNVINLPIDGAGKWGWAEFTYAQIN